MLHPISIGFIPIFGEISLKDMEKHTERERGGGKTGWEFNIYIILVTILAMIGWDDEHIFGMGHI